MLFNSIDFAIFLPIVFVIYWFVCKKREQQNLLIFLASLFFYGWWDYRFLGLLLLSAVVDYSLAILIQKDKNKQKRRILLGISICLNIGILLFFKYFNFFIESFTDAFQFLGYKINASRLSIILPVGISFYTFQTLSYTIDVFKGKMKPTRDFIAFGAFVSFFPQLVAGPIERASNLLPQFFNNRKFVPEHAKDGLRQILWGLFKKVVIADNCSVIVNEIFQGADLYSGSTLLYGSVLFAFQIYGDFSGYSDIALGTSRLFGFKLMKNFSYPYFSRDIAEFWRRWHISLSTWFRDYLYIPLGGSQGNILKKIRNVLIIFLVSGFWHGANWTFIIWGGVNALFFLPLFILKRNRKNTETVAAGKLIPNIREFLSMLFTFAIVVLAWVFFRSDNITIAFDIISKIISSSLFNYIEVFSGSVSLLIVFLITVEWLNRDKDHPLIFLKTTSLPYRFRWVSYILLGVAVLAFIGKSNSFIYFQF